MAAPPAANPGSNMAAEIDKEVGQFRELQELLQQVRGDLQLVSGQLTENEMVQQELELLDSNAAVYKMIGPVLIRNSLQDAQETVTKRFEFINSEKQRLEAKQLDLEKQASAISLKVQEMQANLQRATAAAVQEVAKQHAAG